VMAMQAEVRATGVVRGRGTTTQPAAERAADM
jgi:hypothetical protein